VIESSEDLRAAIRDLGVVDPDPAHVAKKILDGLSNAEAQVIAALTLPDYARRVLGQPYPVTPPEEQEQPGREPPVYLTARGEETPSWRTAMIRDHVDAQLMRRVHGVNEHKHLGDCTEDDLVATAEMRRKKAAEVRAEAEWFDGILAALRDDPKATVVRELPRAVLARVLARR
jgi:hypothetical protein